MGKSPMNYKSVNSTVTGMALAASLGSGLLLLPGSYLLEAPVWSHLEAIPWTYDPITLTEKDSGAIRQIPVQGIEWTSSDAWFVPVRDSIYELLSMQENWDSYGAAPIRPEFVATASSLLRSIMDQNTPLPAIVPTTPGGVQIEWHRDGIDLEIEIQSTSQISVYFEDARTGVSWEEGLTSDLHKLSDVVSLLSRHAGNRA
jgi:hypothetical protein